MNKATPDHYQTLGLDPKASPEEIKKRYRELARRYHPDLNPDPKAAQQITAINEAYHVLNDPDRRSVYDAHRILNQPAAARAAGGQSNPPPHSASAGAPPRPQSPRSTDSARTAGTGPSRPYPSDRAGFNGFGRTAPDDASGQAPPRSTGAQQSARRPAGRDAPPKSSTVNTLVSEAQLAFVNRRYKEAEALCKQALDLDRRNAVVYELLGDIYARKGQTESATTAYSYAIQFNPRNYSIHGKLDRMIGRPEARDSGPTMTRPVATPRPDWGGMADTHRDLSLMLLSIVLVLAFAGVFIAFHQNPGEALVIGLPWLTMLSLNMIVFAIFGGVVTGMLLAFYGGMGSVKEEMVRHEKSAKGNEPKRSSPISLVVLLGLFSVVFFYMSAAVFIGIGMIYNNLSRSLLRAYIATGVLIGLFSFLTTEVNARFNAGAVAVFIGNVIFPAILGGWALGDTIRLRGRR